VGVVPVREEKVELEYLTSPLIQTQESKGSILRILIPIVVLVVVIAGAGYLYFTGKKISTSGEPVTIQPAVTNIEAAKPKEVKVAKEAEIEKENTKSQQPAVVDEGDYYTVQVKDQLNEIGKKYYGNYKDWKKIYDLNKEKIGDPNLIYPGQKFIIPK
jgi:nucleoid-associated protein YgaU